MTQPDTKQQPGEARELGRPLEYEEVAHVIHLYLEEWCDETLPYSNMCAEAARRAKSAYDALRQERDDGISYWSHRAAKHRAEADALKVEVERLKAALEQAQCFHSWDVYGSCELCGL